MSILGKSRIASAASITRVLIARPNEGSAYITRGTIHVMLEQAGVGRNWITGPLEVPHGRGVNFQVAVPEVEPILSALRAADG